MKAIFTKYHGPTNTRGSRLSADDHDGNRVYLDYDQEATSQEMHDRAALALCKKLDWSGVLVRGDIHASGCVYVWLRRDCFLTARKEKS